jgi:predicted nucleic acid-binding protein
MIAYLDANIVIYLVEADRTWLPKARARISALQAAGHDVGISAVHRLECLVGPLILADAAGLAAYAAFFAFPMIKDLPTGTPVFERAARIRANHGYRALDSLHLAAAVEGGCGLFITNDARLAGFPDVQVEILT